MQLSGCEVLLLTRPRLGRGSPQEECCVWRLLDKGTGRLVRADLLSSLVCNVPLGNVKEAIQQTMFDFTLPLLFTGSRALQVLATQEMNALENVCHL